MNNSAHNNPVWLAGPAALVAAAAALLVGITCQLSLASLASILGLAVIAAVTHLWDHQISRAGYISLAFYLAVLISLAPEQTFAFKAGTGENLIAGARWGAGALVLMLGSIGALYRREFSHVIAYAGANAMRWIVVGGAIVVTHRAVPPGWPPLLVETVAGLMAYAVFDAVVTRQLMSNADETEQSQWEAVTSRPILPLQVALGALAAGFAQSALPWVQDAHSAYLVNLFAAGLATALIPFIAGALKSYMDEVVLVDQEAMQISQKRLEHDLRQLREDQQSLNDDVKKKNEELTIIYDLARSLGASTNLAETTQLVQSMIRRLRIPYQSLVIFLSKPGGGLDPALADTPYQEVLGMSGLLQLQEPFILQVLRDPRPYMNNEVSQSTSEQRIFKDERSLLVVPLMVSKENVGIIYLGSVNPKTHREEHLEKLKMLAAFAAPSIKTALLFEHKKSELEYEKKIREEVEAKNHQLNGLQKLGQAIGASLKIDNTFKVVAENLKQMIPGAQSVILFNCSGNDSHLLKAEFINSPYSDYVRSLAVRNDEGILGKATEMNRTLLVQDAEQYDLQNLINNERCVIVAPLRAEEEILGCLYVGAAKEKTFSEEHRSLVETVSYQASIAVKNARLYEQTQQMAFTDGLTGLYLHRFFQVRLSEEIAWADRAKKPICLCMVDTDHFKTFNDTLGHPAGDALLQEIAALLKDKVRQSDIVCRYGGDEFALILKDLPKEEAIRTCERIRETFQLRFAAAAVQVTSSIGLACYPTDATNKKELAKAADDALYVSKRNGRNRVTAAPTLDEKKHQPEIVQETLPR